MKLSPTEIWDWLRGIDRRVEELRTEVSRLPVRDAKVRAVSISVWEFRKCDDPDEVIYVDNPAVAAHWEGGEFEDEPVALLDRDAVLDCWELIGPAPWCKTGECVLILGWATRCEDCHGCFHLWPCGGGSPTVVRGNGWVEYLSRVIRIDLGSGSNCYTMTRATECIESAVTAFTPDDVEADYADCESCEGCYELTSCVDPLEVMWVRDDIAGIMGVLDPLADVVGNAVVVRHLGVCYEVTDYAAPCVESATTLGLVASSVMEDGCDGCCYRLKECGQDPCGGPEEAPCDYLLVKPDPSDTLDLASFLPGGENDGKVIMLVDYKCYTVSRAEDSDDCTEAQVGLGTVREVFDSCECCGITCWNECGTSNYIRTYNDLCEYKRSDVAVKRAEDGKCYKYESSLGACGEPAIVPFTIESTSEATEEETDACLICLAGRYKLTSACGCEGVTPDVKVTEDSLLAEAVGQYVKVSGRCYTVAATSETETDPGLDWEGPFPTCTACIANTRIKVITKRDGSYYATEIEGSFTICSDELVSEPCPE